MAEFRNIVANGDLIRQQAMPRWWFFGEKDWAPYRNLSREVRYLEERMHQAHAVYKAAQEDFVVAQKNVSIDIDVLRVHKLDNTEVSYELPSDESILTRREGVKYSSGNSSGQKQKGQNNNGNGNGGNNGGGNGGNNNQNQNQNKQKQQNKPKSLFDMLINTKVVTTH